VKLPKEITNFQELRERQKRGDGLVPFAFAEILQERNDYPGIVACPGTVRVKVLRNPFARHALPENTFRGPFDQHWGLDRENGWFSLLWMGSELNLLRARSNPVPFWLL